MSLNWEFAFEYPYEEVFLIYEFRTGKEKQEWLDQLYNPSGIMYK